MIEQGVEPLGQAGSPIGIVRDFRGTCRRTVGGMTLVTNFSEDFVAFTFADGDTVSLDNGTLRLNPRLRGGIGGFFNRSVIAAAGQFDQKIKGSQQNDDAADQCG